MFEESKIIAEVMEIRIACGWLRHMALFQKRKSSLRRKGKVLTLWCMCCYYKGPLFEFIIRSREGINHRKDVIASAVIGRPRKHLRRNVILDLMIMGDIALQWRERVKGVRTLPRRAVPPKSWFHYKWWGSDNARTRGRNGSDNSDGVEKLTYCKREDGAVSVRRCPWEVGQGRSWGKGELWRLILGPQGCLGD